jgi:crotonobetainyl-CoA:carnitine CoA-transferase CaiB-like acyl-CoA transferase
MSAASACDAGPSRQAGRPVSAAATAQPGGGVLDGVRVLEVTSDPGVAYSGRLLLLHGAAVSRVAGPAGDEAADPTSLDLYLGAGKRLLDLQTPSAAAITPLLGDYDVILTGPEAYSREVWAQAPRCAVSASLTPFGLTGPYATWAATEKTMALMSGRILLGQQPGEPPRKLPGNQCEFVAGAACFIAVAAALVARERTGSGSAIELAKFEIAVSADNGLYSAYSYLGTVRSAEDAKYITGYPARVYDTMDDPIFVAPGFGNVDMLAVLVERPELLDHPLFLNPRERQDRSSDFDALIQPWLGSHSAAEIVDQAQSLRMPFARLDALNAIADDEQLRSRGFFDVIRTPQADLPVPTSPVRVTAPSSGGAEQSRAEPRERAGAIRGRNPALPLAGIRVVDLTRAYAGPIATAILAEMGAEVIKIESVTRIDMPTRGTNYAENTIGDRGWERAGFYHSVNSGKLGITIDLSSDDGRRLLEELIIRSDLLLENSSARVLPNLGFDIDRLHELNEGLVVVAMSAYGRTGPRKDWIGYAQGMEAASGLMRSGGGDGDRYFSSICAYADWVLGLYGAAAAVIGLLDRARQGKGGAYDVAGVEGVLAHLGDLVIESARSGAPPRRIANGSTQSAPSGTYLAANQRYVVVDVETDDQWRQLAVIMELPEPEREDLRTARQRVAARTRIDEIVTAWIGKRDAEDAVSLLQSGGIPCAVVKAWDEILMDGQLLHRGYFEVIDHPEVGNRPHQRFMPGLWDGVRRPPRSPAPTLGEHNGVVFGGLLGLSPAEIADLTGRGIVGTDPVKLPRRLRDKPLDVASLAADGLLRIDPAYRERLSAFFGHPIGSHDDAAPNPAEQAV